MIKNNVATVVVGNSKYMIESDAKVNITLKNGGSYHSLRVIGVSRMGDCLRGVSDGGGVVEVPLKSINKITDAGESEFPGVEVIRK